MIHPFLMVSITTSGRNDARYYLTPDPRGFLRTIDSKQLLFLFFFFCSIPNSSLTRTTTNFSPHKPQSLMADTAKIIEWATGKGARIHSDASIQESIFGGLGITALKSIAPDTEILRIPTSIIFDKDSLLEIAQEIKAANASDFEIIIAALSIANNHTETSIIRNYTWALSSLKEGRVAAIEPYLSVLLDTPVLDVDESNDNPDSVVMLQILEKRRVREEHEEFAGLARSKVLSFEAAWQLHQAVKSRVLEIPHALDDSGDYTTSVSLVPLLDFANHSETANAVFDVDRSSNDVILRTTGPVAQGSEVCISYSPSLSLQLFMRTYGFMPASGVYNWVIPDIDDILATKKNHRTNYSAMAKWLHVLPHLTIIAGPDFRFDIAENNLPLLLIPGLQYHQDWEGEADIAQDLAAVYPDHDSREIVESLRYQELNSDRVLAGDTAYGVVFDDAYVSLPYISEQTRCNNEVAIAQLLQDTLHVIHEAAKRAIEADSRLTKRNANEMLVAYFMTKTRLLQQVLLATSMEDYASMQERTTIY